MVIVHALWSVVVGLAFVFGVGMGQRQVLKAIEQTIVRCEEVR